MSRPACNRCGEPGHAYTVVGGTTEWFANRPDAWPSVSLGAGSPQPQFIAYCPAHALAFLHVSAIDEVSSE